MFSLGGGLAPNAEPNSVALLPARPCVVECLGPGACIVTPRLGRFLGAQGSFIDALGIS